MKCGMGDGFDRQAGQELVENFGTGRHGDGGGLYLVVDPSGARRWIVSVVVKGQRNAKGAPLRTDFGLGGVGVVGGQGFANLCRAREGFANAAKLNTIIRGAFAAVPIPQHTPHSFRKTLTHLGSELTKTPE